MGIILQDSVNISPLKQESNCYVNFNKFFNVIWNKDNQIYNIEAVFQIYDELKEKIVFKKNLQFQLNDLSQLYSKAYSELKLLFPNCIDEI